jgi:hypothetical protein
MRLIIAALVALGLTLPAFATERVITAVPGEKVIIHVKPTAKEALKARCDTAEKKLDEKSKKAEEKKAEDKKVDEKTKKDEIKVDIPKKDGEHAAPTDEHDEHDE